MSSNINKNNILGEYQPYDIKTYTSDNDNSNQPLIFVEYDDNRKQPLFRKTNLSYNPSTNTLNVVNLNVSGTGGGDTTSIDITDTDTAGTYYITFASDTGTEQTLRADKTTTALTYNPNTSTISATQFNGNASTSTQTNVIDDTTTNGNLNVCFASATGNTSIRTCSDGILMVNPNTGITSIDLLNCPDIQGVGVISGNSKNISFTNGTINSGFFASDTTTNTDFSVFFGDTSQTDFGFKYDNSNIAYNPSLSTLKVSKLDNCFASDTSSSSNLSILFIDQTATGKEFKYDNSNISYNPSNTTLNISKLDNCFALTSSGSNLPILFIDQTATGKQFLYNNTNFYYNPTLGEFLLQGNTTTQNINCNNLTMTSTDTGSSANPELILYRNSSSPASGDYIGQIQFKGKNSNGGDEIYAKITGKIRDETLGTEDGLIETSIKGNGSFTIVSRQRDDELQLLNGCGLSVDGKIEGLNDCVIEGDVGIGMAVSTNPLVELHIQGSSGAITSNGLDGIVQIATGSGQTDNKLCFGVVDDDYSYLQAFKNNSGGTGFDFGNLILNSGGGNVGIGTTSSTMNFRVDGDSMFGDAVDNTKYGLVQIVRVSAQPDNKHHLSFVRNGNKVAGMGFLPSSNVFQITNNSFNSTTDGIHLTANAVGINTTSPAQALHVNGNQQIRNTASASYLTLVNHLSGIGWNIFTNYSTTFNNFHIQNATGGGGVYMSSGDTFWRSMSDDRLKHNEVEITNGLEVIMKMKPQFYDRSSQMLDADFNGNLDELGIKYYKESGFIAQEVYEIPELRHIVDDSDSDMPWSIIYPQIIPYNTSAIQQLKKENDELKNKVLELENEINLIKQHLNLT